MNVRARLWWNGSILVEWGGMREGMVGGMKVVKIMIYRNANILFPQSTQLIPITTEY